MKKRAAFLNAAQGVFLARPSFVIQRNNQDESEVSRFGFTVTKKVGNAVVRNRVRRRLKEAVRYLDDQLVEAGYDYVLIGRKETMSIDFKVLCTDIETALKKLARGKGRPAKPRRRA